MALLIPAMDEGGTLTIDGEVSDALLRQLSAVQEILSAIIPDLRPVEVKAAGVRDLVRPEGVATGFSAGVDSFHLVSTNPGLTHLLFNNVGSHGVGGRELFWARFERAKKTADRLGFPLVPVDSNVDDFYRHSFQQTHTVRNASVALLLQGGIGQWLYASGRQYREVRVAPTHIIAYGCGSSRGTSCWRRDDVVGVA